LGLKRERERQREKERERASPSPFPLPHPLLGPYSFGEGLGRFQNLPKPSIGPGAL